MTEPTAVPTTERTETTVPAPRSAPQVEARPRRRHDGFYWDMSAAGWKPSPGR